MPQRKGKCGDCVFFESNPSFIFCHKECSEVEPDSVCIGKKSSFESRTLKTKREYKKLGTSFRPETIKAMQHAIELGIRSDDFDIKMASHIRRALKQLYKLEQKHQKIKLTSTP